jgi:hypothetical protein
MKTVEEIIEHFEKGKEAAWYHFHQYQNRYFMASVKSYLSPETSKTYEALADSFRKEALIRTDLLSFIKDESRDKAKTNT